MKSPRTERIDGAEPDDDLDARFVQRSLSTLRERVRMQEDELDTLRAMIRTMQKGNTSEQMAHLQERLGALEASVQHVRAENSDETVETVATRIRNEVLTRVKALEANQAEHGNTVQQMREMAGRTDFNLQRLLVEVERLVTEVARRPEPTALMADPVAQTSQVPGFPETALPDVTAPMFESDVIYPRFRWKIPALLLVGLLGIFLVVWVVASRYRGTSSTTADASSALSPIEQGRIYESQKDYPKAEAIYRDILKKEPNNTEVIKHLASMLFREDKVDESAAMMAKLPRSN